MLVYAVLLRANAFLAVAPLLAFAFRRPLTALPLSRTRGGLVPVLVGFTGLVGLTAGLAFGPVNHRLLRAADQHAIDSLILFDTAGVARFSHDITVLPSHGLFAYETLERCYSPELWDTLKNGPCAVINRLPPNRTDWLHAIAQHPLAYLRHRAEHENAELKVFTSIDFSPDATLGGRPIAEGVRAYGLAKSLLEWGPLLAWGIPGFWLPVDFALLALKFLRSRRAEIGHFDQIGAALLSSAVLYWAGYFVFGVANAYRYSFYPFVASGVAVVFLGCQRWRDGQALERPEKDAAWALLMFALLLSALHVVNELLRHHAFV